MNENTTAAKNLSWRNGFVSSIDGKIVAEVEESKEDLHIQQHKGKQQGNTNQQEGVEENTSTMDTFRTTTSSKQPTISILKATSINNMTSSTLTQRWPIMSNKNNATSELRTLTASGSAGRESNLCNKGSVFEYEYQRKLQLLRSNAKKKEEKLFVLLNRNEGVITHVIRTNPNYIRK